MKKWRYDPATLAAALGQKRALRQLTIDVRFTP
jgi:hypothetical protein